MSAILDLATELVTADAEDALAVSRFAVRIAGGGEAGARAALDLGRLTGRAADPGMLADRLEQVAPEDALDETALLVAACFGALRAPYPSRQDAVAARSAISARADAAYRTSGALDPGMLDWLIRLAGETVRQLSGIAADRAPLVRVETGFSLPASRLAWDLYGDPSRDEELAERNMCGTAMMMPVVIEAVAS